MWLAAQQLPENCQEQGRAGARRAQSPGHSKWRPQHWECPSRSCGAIAALQASAAPSPGSGACLPPACPAGVTHSRPLPIFHFHPAPRRGVTSSSISFLSSQALEGVRDPPHAPSLSSSMEGGGGRGQRPGGHPRYPGPRQEREDSDRGESQGTEKQPLEQTPFSCL